MAEWENVPLDPTTKKKKKQRVNLEPRRPMAARLKKKQEDLLDLITALLKFNCSLSTTVAAQCSFKSSL